MSEAGDAVIAYSAALRWGALSVSYAGALVKRRGKPTERRATLRAVPPPSVAGGAITWSAPRLGLGGRWTPIVERAAEDVVFAGSEGSVTWRCLAPRARAEIDLAGERLRGLGYVEHLQVTVPPWEMPIDELRWGRFLSEDASLTWVDWRGPHRRQIALLDADAVEPLVVGDDRVEAGTARLSIEAPEVLRRGALGKTTLSLLPAAEALLPVRILATDEQKWVARGTLEHGGRRSQGWVVHEVVRWP